MKVCLNSIMIFCSILMNLQYELNAQNDSITKSKFVDNRDSNVYETIIIGGKQWLLQNLNIKTEKSWCEKCEIYGRLYSYEDAKMACPPGWHIPTLEEWKKLVFDLGGEELIKNRMKFNKGWLYSKVPITNACAFNAIATPYVTVDGKIRKTGSHATWWTSTLALEPANWTYRITYNNDKIECWGFYKVSGFSVRCIKD